MGDRNSNCGRIKAGLYTEQRAIETNLSVPFCRPFWWTDKTLLQVTDKNWSLEIFYIIPIQRDQVPSTFLSQWPQETMLLASLPVQPECIPTIFISTL
jgi:hypothetical protein